MQNPLQRHTSFKPLSRDHGVGLVCVQGLQRAVRSSRSERVRLAQEMKTVCNHIILPYLADEQKILSPLIGDKVLREKFNSHHAEIRRLATALDKCKRDVDPGVGLFARIGDAIDDYVRWEENALFPTLERRLNGAQLESLQRHTDRMEIEHKRPTQILHRSMSSKAKVA